MKSGRNTLPQNNSELLKALSNSPTSDKRSSWIVRMPPLFRNLTSDYGFPPAPAPDWVNHLSPRQPPPVDYLQVKIHRQWKSNTSVDPPVDYPSPVVVFRTETPWGADFLFISKNECSATRRKILDWLVCFWTGPHSPNHHFHLDDNHLLAKNMLSVHVTMFIVVTESVTLTLCWPKDHVSGDDVLEVNGCEWYGGVGIVSHQSRCGTHPVSGAWSWVNVWPCWSN